MRKKGGWESGNYLRWLRFVSICVEKWERDKTTDHTRQSFPWNAKRILWNICGSLSDMELKFVDPSHILPIQRAHKKANLSLESRLDMTRRIYLCVGISFLRFTVRQLLQTNHHKFLHLRIWYPFLKIYNNNKFPVLLLGIMILSKSRKVRKKFYL